MRHWSRPFDSGGRLDFRRGQDGSPSNYNANYCKALTTVTFNRLGTALGISCHLESEPSSLAVTNKRHMQEIERQ